MILFSITKLEDTGSEPVTLAEAQVFFRSEQSGGIESDLITSLLKMSRMTIERQIGRSLVDKNIEIEAMEFEDFLPFGPVVNDSFEFITGTGTLIGTKYPHLECIGLITARYSTVAYISLDLNIAILELALYNYQRGEYGKRLTAMRIPPKIKTMLLIHTRKTFVG